MNILYLLGSLAGVGLLVLLNVLLLGRARLRVDAAAAVGCLAQEYPGFRARRSSVARDNTAALVEDQDNQIYLVVGTGDRLASRKLDAGSLARLGRNGDTLSLRLRDFAFAPARFAFAEAGEADDWYSRLAPLLAR